MLGIPHRHLIETDSTNEEALRWGREDAPHGAFVTADAQTAGRGRRGRSWNSPPGKGLYLSLILRPGPRLDSVPRLNFAACLAGARVLHELTGLECHTKWPNDILLGDHKVGGVLSEADVLDGKLNFVVVGLGLNVNHTADDLPPRPIYPASSLLLATGHEWPVPAVTEAWLHDFEVFYNRLMRGEWNAMRGEFWRKCAQRGQIVTVQGESGDLTGTASALDYDGALLIETKPASTARLSAIFCRIDYCKLRCNFALPL